MPSLPRVRVVSPGLEYAWICCDQQEAGIAFDRAFSSPAFGWRNTLANVAPGGDGHLSANVPNLRIKMFGTLQRGLLGAPKDPAAASFVVDWLLNPGVDARGQLTTASSAKFHADLVVLSGHGQGGRVYGTETPVSGCQYGRHYATVGPTAASNGWVKYLIIAACTQVSWPAFESYWAPLFQRETAALRGILGYALQYPGGTKGAVIMRRFAENLKAGKTVLQSWIGANADRPTWGALVYGDAKNDTLDQWVHSKLPPINIANRVLHYQREWPNGKALVTAQPPPAIVNFTMSDGTIITRDNRDQQTVGLFVPSAQHPNRNIGTLILRAPAGQMLPSQPFQLAFYNIRPNTTGVTLDSLLRIPDAWFQDSSPGLPARLRKVTGANTRAQGGYREDGLEISMRVTSNELRLPFTVQDPGPMNWTPHDGTYGLIGTILFPPGLINERWEFAFDSYADCPYLRASP